MNYKEFLARELSKEIVKHYIENKATYDKFGIPLDENLIASVLSTIKVEADKKNIREVLRQATENTQENDATREVRSDNVHPNNDLNVF